MDKKTIKISETLPPLLKQKGVSIRQASKATKIPQSTLNSWTQKSAKPQELTLIKTLADYLNVSVDYLLWEEKPKANVEQMESEVVLSGLYRIKLEKIKER
jgi:transcriptional regulator with XRE-family HTH domain